MSESRRFLILDDDIAIGKTMVAIAESSPGIAARFTTQHQEFFDCIEQWRPTYIALDLVMPEMDGVQVLGELAERKCKAGIIITSGVGHRVLEAASRSAKEHGLRIIGVLSKPFSPRVLRELLQSSGDSGSPEMNVESTVSGAHAEPAFVVSEHELDRALKHRELEVYFQPKIHCATRRLAGFEALVRWRHPHHGLIMPDRFVVFAEVHGLIDRLTSQVFDTALDWFCRNFSRPGINLAVNLSAVTIANLALSMNVSARTLRDQQFVESMLMTCESKGLDPSRMIFELTETSAMENPTASLDLLTRLRMKGFQLSIDDFGTGFSSMLQLVRLPFSEIKVDKSFVITAMNSAESRTVIKSIIELGHSLGLKATAEGVEDEATLKYLTDIGCDLAQGYYIARPMTGEAAVEWTKQRAIKT
jgi:EAL domain-containing protein (putative c-di-GMP-specific phosphodiesterase class I)/FixJ family two-component response regulator